MSDWLEEGKKAPDFALPSDDGGTVRLKDLRGRTTVVYFYPRDNTPGCTREACAFRDRRDELARRNVAVLGISTDDLRSHARFREKFALNFPLLADVEHRTAESFGAWREKMLYGKTSWGVVRSTFLIDAGGTVRKVWRRVNVDGHDAEVVAAVDALLSGTVNRSPPRAAVNQRPAKKTAARPKKPKR